MQQPTYYTLTPLALKSPRIFRLDRRTRNILFCLADLPRSVAELATLLHMSLEAAYLDINWLVVYGLVTVKPTLAEAARQAERKMQPPAPRPSFLKRLFSSVGGRHDRQTRIRGYAQRAA